MAGAGAALRGGRGAQVFLKGAFILPKYRQTYLPWNATLPGTLQPRCRRQQGGGWRELTLSHRMGACRAMKPFCVCLNFSKTKRETQVTRVVNRPTIATKPTAGGSGLDPTAGGSGLGRAGLTCPDAHSLCGFCSCPRAGDLAPLPWTFSLHPTRPCRPGVPSSVPPAEGGEVWSSPPAPAQPALT